MRSFCSQRAFGYRRAQRQEGISGRIRSIPGLSDTGGMSAAVMLCFT